MEFVVDSDLGSSHPIDPARVVEELFTVSIVLADCDEEEAVNHLVLKGGRL